MSIPAFLLFLAGLGLLIGGAEFLVRGATRMAVAAGIPPVVVGLTVVSYGTSSPELAVAVQSAWSSQTQLGLGNIIGSNIFNVLFVLGLSAAITPLVVSRRLVRLDVPVMVGLSFLVLLMGLDGEIGRLDGIVLTIGAIVYTAWLLRSGRKENKGGGTSRQRRRLLPVPILSVLLGVVLLVIGSDWLVDGASVLARNLGISELVIGLTIVAVGTSLPEVVTSVLASIRKERDIAVGNVVGSNIFNILLVLGLAATLSPSGIPVPPDVISFDLPVMIAVAVACLPVFFSKHRISRWEGILFFGYYIAFTAYLVLEVMEHQSQETFSDIMLYFVVPITIVTLIIVSYRSVMSARETTKSHPG
ncbi:MAG: calcium/sodium antiporter [Bacteroidetes bacterium]|nr:calcium/sodium antiporter [Bacteroidota bacterium]